MTGWPEPYGRVILDEVDSTLDEAVRLSATCPAPFWIMSHRQTAARGRRGRVWKAPAGNLFATLLLRPDEPPASLALRSFVMSLALFRALEEVTRNGPVFALKWPNDVLLSGGKLAGILLESGGRTDGQAHLAIGVGVNLAAAPLPEEVEEGALRPVCLREALSVEVSPEDFLDGLARHYAALETRFQREGFGPIRSDWLARAARLGQTVTARTVRETHQGIFEDVDGEGQLVLRGPRGRVSLAAADVFF